jgi:hypothetical protein
VHSRASQPRLDLARGFANVPRSAKAAWACICRTFRSIVSWLRSGYPDEAPTTGYSPLLALNGPMTLSAKQTQHVVDELAGTVNDIIDVGVAITKITGLLPTPSQIRAIAQALEPN